MTDGEISNILGEDSDVRIKTVNGKWHSYQDKTTKGKQIRDKARMLAIYKKAIGTNPDLSGQEKAALMNRNVTDL